MMAQRQGLTKEVTELTQEEKKLDELIQSCTLDLKLLTEDSENQRYPFCQNLSKDQFPCCSLNTRRILSSNVIQTIR